MRNRRPDLPCRFSIAVQSQKAIFDLHGQIEKAFSYIRGECCGTDGFRITDTEFLDTGICQRCELNDASANDLRGLLFAKVVLQTRNIFVSRDGVEVLYCLAVLESILRTSKRQIRLVSPRTINQLTLECTFFSTRIPEDNRCSTYLRFRELFLSITGRTDNTSSINIAVNRSARNSDHRILDSTQRFFVIFRISLIVTILSNAASVNVAINHGISSNSNVHGPYR